MRHRRRVNQLSRTSAHRKAMLANMASSLIMHKRITTTLAKAKALRSYVEPLITKSKLDSTQSRRLVFSYLQDKEAVTELFREVSQKVGERPGGYTRIIKLGNRLGDNAEMCLIELVDYNENLLQEKESEKKAASRSTRRGRRGAGKKSTEEKASTPAVTQAKEESPAAETKVEKPDAEVEKVEEKAEVKEVAEKKEEKVEEPKEEKKEEAPAAEAKEEEKEEDEGKKKDA